MKQARMIGLPLLLMMLVAIFLLTSTPFDEADAGRRSGVTYSSSTAFDYTLTDSTAHTVDTLSTVVGSSTQPFRFTAVKDYSSLYGYWTVSYYHLDTNGSGNVMDTANDSVIVHIITADESGTPWRIIWYDTLANIHETDSLSNADYTWFNLSDSGFGDVVYARFIYWAMDSTNEHVRDTVYTTFKAQMKMWAK